MQKLVVIIFDGRSKARAGLKALRGLDRDGELSLFEVALAVKAPNGRVRVIENPNDVNFPAVGVGSLTGSVLGALGGPIGILAGAAAGALIGFIINLERSGVTDDFINDVSAAMAPANSPWSPMSWRTQRRLWTTEWNRLGVSFSGELAAKSGAFTTIAMSPHTGPRWNGSKPNGPRPKASASTRLMPRSTGWARSSKERSCASAPIFCGAKRNEMPALGPCGQKRMSHKKEFGSGWRRESPNCSESMSTRIQTPLSRFAESRLAGAHLV